MPSSCISGFNAQTKKAESFMSSFRLWMTSSCIWRIDILAIHACSIRVMPVAHEKRCLCFGSVNFERNGQTARCHGRNPGVLTTNAFRYRGHWQGDLIARLLDNHFENRLSAAARFTPYETQSLLNLSSCMGTCCLMIGTPPTTFAFLCPRLRFTTVTALILTIRS